MALAEDREIAAIIALEHALDPGISGGCQMGRVETVARGESVMHALAHGLVLRGHQARGLRAGNAERVLIGRGIKPEQRARGDRGRMGAEHRPGMPAARQHLGSVQRHAHPRTDLQPLDRAEQQRRTIDAAALLGASDQRGQDQRGAVQRTERMKIVKLEALDERAVEQRGCGSGRSPAPADDRLVARALEPRDRFDGQCRPGQLRPDQCAADAIEQQIFRALAHGLRDIIEP
jgi:hypothetical protein